MSENTTQSEVTTFGESVTFPLTEKQYNDLSCIKAGIIPDEANPGKTRYVGKKDASVHFGYDQPSTEAPLEELFDPSVQMHPNFDPTKPLAEQSVDMVRLAVYAATCACGARTCTQQADMGCELSRDPEAMHIIDRAITLKQTEVGGEKRYSLELQLRSTANKPDSVEYAYNVFTKNSRFLITANMCAETAACVIGCTFHKPDMSVPAALRSLIAAADRQGVFESTFEALLKMLARMVGLERESFKKIEPSKPESVAVIGGGPGGGQAVIKVAEMGYHAHLFDMQDGFGGAANTAITGDKHPIADFRIYGEYMKNVGVNTHYRTKVGTSLTPEQAAAGITLISADEILRRYDAVILNPGIYDRHHSRKLDGVAGEEGRGVITAEYFLLQTETYMQTYGEIQKAALLEERAKGAEFNETEFRRSHMQQYFAQNPFVLRVADESYTLDELADMEIFVTGVGDTGHDVVRRLMQFLSLGDPQKFDTIIHWMARKLDSDNARPWGDNNLWYPNEQKPTVHMMRKLQEDGKPITDEYLTFIAGLERDGQGNLTDITLGTRVITNPTAAKINPDIVEYKTGPERSANLSATGKKPLVIAATGFDVRRFASSELGQAFGVVNNAEGFPGQNFHSHYNTEYGCLVLLGGNVCLGSQDTVEKKDLVVNVMAASTVAADHANRFLEAARGQDPEQRAAIAEVNSANILTSEDVFSPHMDSGFDLAKIARGRKVGGCGCAVAKA